MKMPELIRLANEHSICCICPAIGGGITAWSVAGQDMLRPAQMAQLQSGDPLSLSSFPLVPYSNRIGYARFEWAGHTIMLTPNFAPEPHAIHGVGWTENWTVGSKGDAFCKLALVYKGGAAWPWSFSASQRYTLVGKTLQIDLSVQNLSEQRAPLAFGHHPYFPQAGAQLSFQADRVYMVGDDRLPTQAMPPMGMFDFRAKDNLVAGREIDHCYAGWDGRAVISWTGKDNMLEIQSDLDAAVLYIPKDSDIFCFEPVPHINNALNRAGEHPEIPAINPGEYFRTTIKLHAVSRKQ